MKYKYGIVAIDRANMLNGGDDLHIVHFVGYEEQPEFSEYVSLYRELKTDEEFGLEDVDICLLPASEDMIEHFAEDIPEEYK